MIDDNIDDQDSFWGYANDASKTKKVVSTNKSRASVIETEIDGFIEQLTLFGGIQNVVDTQVKATNNKLNKLTNLTGIYGLIPKRVYRNPSDKKLILREYRTSKGLKMDLEIKPALITHKVNGMYVNAFKYPGLREDRVEEALAYIASQGGVSLNPNNKYVQVLFTVRQVRRVLEEVLNKTYSGLQVREALDVLSQSFLNIRISHEGREIKFTGTRISQLITIGRAEWLAADENDDTQCSCVFHTCFAGDVAEGNFFIHDLSWQGKFKHELAADLFKSLSVHYRQASVESPYRFAAKMFLENTSHGFSYTNSSRSWGGLLNALNELKELRVISGFDDDIRYQSTGGQRKIIDRIITIYAHEEYMKQTIYRNYVKKALKS